MCYCVVPAWLSLGLINPLEIPETFGGSPKGSVAGAVLGVDWRATEGWIRQFRPLR